VPAVPAYEPMLAAYHRAFARELRSMLDNLPIAPGQSILDIACGDGVYSPWLAETVGPSGRVVAVDVMPEYLELARKEAAKSPHAKVIEHLAAPIESLPFEDGTFDAVWCAQSLYSLPEPVAALRHMLRVTKPGGIVAVLEGDTLHHVILPWPIEVELSVRAAELQALVDKSNEPRKFYVGRRLRGVFREAGLGEIQARTFATDREAPLGPDERTYFAEYLEGLTHRVDRDFHGPIREEYDRLTNPDSGTYLLDDPDLTATCIDQVVWGRKPARS
jgi:ubiquinone/menaquinone biosynthesis C-methylase UbiE